MGEVHGRVQASLHHSLDLPSKARHALHAWRLFFELDWSLLILPQCSASPTSFIINHAQGFTLHSPTMVHGNNLVRSHMHKLDFSIHRIQVASTLMLKIGWEVAVEGYYKILYKPLVYCLDRRCVVYLKNEQSLPLVYGLPSNHLRSSWIPCNTYKVGQNTLK